jgi:DNA-binding winged helix-turn-helix (wHTH) protein
MTDSPQDLQDFRLAQWLVQPSLDQLASDGAVVRIRPQLMDLLVCLAAGAGRTVTRKEIAAAIWPGQFASDSGLARCVAELRQALGDSARQPRIIETIPKRGYRLIAPVSPAAREVPAPAPPRLSPFDRTIARLSIVAMAIGARLWRRRAVRPSGPDVLGPQARASAARAS